MTNKVNHSELKQIIKEFYKKKLALFIWGSYGLGKSRVLLDSAKEIAESKGREFVEWNKASREQKQRIYEYPEEYFCYTDLRLSEFDAGDFKLPKFTDNSEMIEWKIPMCFNLMCKENSDGILAFEELNLATPLVMSSVYKIIYDRFISEYAMNNNWLIVGCGNLETDKAFTHPLPNPLKDRAGECFLQICDVDDWVTDFAIPNGIDSRIIGFLNFKPASLHIVDDGDAQKDCTPRGFERLSTLIKGVTDWKVIGLLSNCAIGKGTAVAFVSFCRISEKLKLEEIIKNPEKIKNLKKIDEKFFLVSAMAERYKDKKIKFDIILKASEVLDEISNAPFVALLWRLCISYSKEQFKKDFLNSKGNYAICKKYERYIV